jgi:hypothetical protein
MSNPRTVLRLRERVPAQSKQISNVGRNCQLPEESEQQKGRSATQQNSVLYRRQAERGRMARKPIPREVLLGAILDVVMGLALAAGTVYVAALYLAQVG